MRRWQHTLAGAQAVYNWGGPRGKHFEAKPLGYLFERMFPETKSNPHMTLAEYREKMKGIRNRD